jgi:DNA polymerase III epsilon subunit-like protein
MKNDRKQSIVQGAQALFALPNFCILDTETTGLDDNDEIVEIALIDKNGKCDTFS